MKKENPVKTPGFCQKPFGWLNSLVHCSVPWFLDLDVWRLSDIWILVFKWMLGFWFLDGCLDLGFSFRNWVFGF